MREGVLGAGLHLGAKGSEAQSQARGTSRSLGAAPSLPSPVSPAAPSSGRGGGGGPHLVEVEHQVQFTDIVEILV